MTLTTIKKAAPLMLLGVALSGTAFAVPGENQGKKPIPRPDNPPKASVDVRADCDICDYIDAYGNCIVVDLSNPLLRVRATITDMSGDEFSLTEDDFVDRNAKVQYKNKGPHWYSYGAPQTLAPNGYTGTWDTVFDLCVVKSDIDDDRSASAIVNVTVASPDGTETAFVSRCENFDPDPNTPEDEDGIDQSNFDMEALGVVCSP